MIEDIIRRARESSSLKIPTTSPKSPAVEQLLRVSLDSPPLSENAQTTFHLLLAKFNFVAGRGRQDLTLALSRPLKRVVSPTEEDEKKLARFVGYAISASDLTLRLGCHLTPKVTTFIDASFATHSNMKSHSEVCISLGTGAYCSKSTAQKLNTTSSCGAELAAISKGLQQSLWSSYFIQNQGYLSPITVLQDNQSTIKLVENSRPTMELSRHIRIGYFRLHDLILKNVIKLVQYPTEFMIVDIMTKPLQGSLFRTMRDRIMGDVQCPMTVE